MCSTRGISEAFKCAALYAINGATNSGMGSTVLRAAGYAGYSLSGTVMGAAGAGGAVVGAVFGLVSGSFFNNRNGNNSRNFREVVKGAIAGTALNIGLSTASGVLGSVMLNAIAEVPLAKIAATMAVGAGVTGGAAAVLILGCALMCMEENNAAAAAPIDIPVIAPGGPRMV